MQNVSHIMLLFSIKIDYPLLYDLRAPTLFTLQACNFCVVIHYSRHTPRSRRQEAGRERQEVRGKMRQERGEVRWEGREERVERQEKERREGREEEKRGERAENRRRETR